MKNVTNRLVIDFRCRRCKGYHDNVEYQKEKLLDMYIFECSSAIKVGVERVNQASKPTRTEVDNIIDVAVNCVRIVEQIIR